LILFSRRIVLAAGLAAPVIASARPVSASDSVAACRATLARLFPNSLADARAIGARCADGQPAAVLIDRLCGSAAVREHLARGPAEEVRTMLDARIRRDFSEGRTRLIDGWVLSETEARLFAILAS
jgi:hypothetical protein